METAWAKALRKEQQGTLKNNGDRSSEGRGRHEVRLEATEARLGERAEGALRPR